MSQAPITPGKTQPAVNGPEGADRYTISDRLLRPAPGVAHAETLLRHGPRVTTFPKAKAKAAAVARICLYLAAMQPIWGLPVRPMVGCASHFWLDSGLIGQLPFPEAGLPGSSADPLLAGLFAHNGKGLIVRIAGTVKFFNGAKGFGFISPEDGSKDVFVHVSAIERAGLRTLNEGDRVTFVLEDDRKGRGKQAAQIEKA
jgi:CspA family cold shock protein